MSHLEEPIWDGNGGTLDPRKATQRELLVAAHIKLDRVVKDVADQETRVRSLEDFKAKAVGALLVTAPLSGVIGAIVERHAL